MSAQDEAPSPSVRESYTYPRLQVPLFGAEYLEYARRQLFTRHPDYLTTLVRLLDVHPGMTVIDAGCGSGFYTRLIASRMQGEGHAVGIDPDANLLVTARQATIREGWEEIITYYHGLLSALPAPDSAADLVFSNTTLWTVPEEQRVSVIKEFRRVLRPGGRLLVAEPDGGMVHAYDPKRPRLQELEERIQIAFVKGTIQLDGHDYMIGRKLPTLFQMAGFQRVRLYPRLFVVAGCDLGLDPRQGILDRVKEYQQTLAGLLNETAEGQSRQEHRNQRLRAGGISDKEIAEHRELTIARLRELTEHPDAILQDTSVYTYGGLFCEGYQV
jgi:ubiquinone/menaquinone biosynthesis C-methylase UbiE